MTRRRRVLFVAEAVTLAQVVRLAVLARSLPADRYEVHFASAVFDELVFAGAGFQRWLIHSLSPGAMDRRVRGGRRIYGRGLLRRYLADDLALIDRIRPDVVVGDLRLSLAVAAPLRRVPHVALINAYWSPHARRTAWPLPDHPIVRLLGPELAGRYFPRALPWVFRHFAAPVNDLRRAHGLPPLGSLPEVLCHADLTLFPDPEALVPVDRSQAPAHHQHLGPVTWSPVVPLPPWWSALGARRPLVYVTLGSSGRAELLPAALGAVAALGAQAVVATAGRVDLPQDQLPPGSHVAAFLPGDRAAERADVVVCNGGSTTAYQALAAGKPVVGIAGNLDQYLSMQAITDAGAGVLVRAGTAGREVIQAAIGRCLSDGALAAAARRLMPAFTAARPAERFRAALDRLAA